MKASERLNLHDALDRFCAHVRQEGIVRPVISQDVFARYFGELSEEFNSDIEALASMCEWYSSEIRSRQGCGLSRELRPFTPREILETYKPSRAWVMLLARDHFDGKD